MTLINGTTVAATDGQSYAMSKMFGLPAAYGRAEVLGSVPLPDDFVELAHSQGQSVDQFEAYVIKPVNEDGSDLAGPEDWGGDDDPADVAFVAIHNINDVKPQSPIGPLDQVVIASQVSRSEFLASAEVRVNAAADQFAAELAGPDFDQLVAELCDDEDEADPHVD